MIEETDTENENYYTDESLKATSAAYKAVFSTPEGELVLKDLLTASLDKTDICIATKADGALDPLFVANAAGRQYVAHHIRRMLELTQS